MLPAKGCIASPECKPPKGVQKIDTPDGVAKRDATDALTKPEAIHALQKLETIRPGTKLAAIIDAMRHPGGATIAQMMAGTGWQAHYADAQIMPICVGNPASCMAITPTESA